MIRSSELMSRPTSISKQANKPQRKHICQVHKQVALQHIVALDSVHLIGTRDEARTLGTSRYRLPRDKRKRRPQHPDDHSVIRKNTAELPPKPPSANGASVESSFMRCSQPAATSLMPGLDPPTLASNEPVTGANKERHRIENKCKRQSL